MRTRCELWSEELVYLQAALLTREGTAQLAGPVQLLLMRLETLFARRRALRVRTLERAAHLQAFLQDAHAAVEALWQKVQLLHRLGTPVGDSLVTLKAWVSGPARVIPGGASLARLLARLEGISTHPECSELIYLLQELQLEIEMDERESLEDQLAEEELALDAEAFDRDATAMVATTERSLSTLFFSQPRLRTSYFLNGRTPAPKAREFI